MAVVGVGMAGLIVIQFLKLRKAGKIIVLEISSSRSKLAKAPRADVVLSPIFEGQSLGIQIFGLTDWIGADIVFVLFQICLRFANVINYVSGSVQIILIGLHKKELLFSL